MTMTPGHPAGTAVSAAPVPARLGPGDLAGLAAVGLRTRKLRAGLSALGIAIGVAAIVAILGLAASSSAALQNEISQLGTNLLTVTNGQTFTGNTAELPTAAPGMIARLPGVTACRTSARSAAQRLQVPATSPRSTPTPSAWTPPPLSLPAVSGTSLAQGRYLNAATAREPVAVLGYHRSAAAGHRPDPARDADLVGSAPSGGQWFYVTGILNQDTYAPEIDSSVLVGFPAAENYLGFDGHPTKIYVRTTPDDQAVTTSVDNLLGYQANPENPS